MKQKISNQIGDGYIVQQFAETTRPLNLVQAFLYACFGGFSVNEILEAQRN